MHFPQVLAALAALAGGFSGIPAAIDNSNRLTVEPTNLVVNGIFDNETESALSLRNWRYDPRVAGIVSAISSKVMQFTNSRNIAAQIDQDIPTEAGKYYTLSYSVDPCKTADRNQLFIGDMMLSLAPSDKGWRTFDQIPFKGVGPDDSLTLTGGAALGKFCDISWDNFTITPVRISETPAAAEKQLIRNGDFDGKNMRGWNLVATDGTGLQGFGFGAGTEGWSLKLMTLDSKFNRFKMSQKIELVENEDYIISFDHMVDTVVDGAVEIQFSKAPLRDLNKNQEFFHFTFQNTNPRTWTTESRRFRALYKKNMLTFTVQNYHSGAHYIDNIRLVKCQDKLYNTP